MVLSSHNSILCRSCWFWFDPHNLLNHLQKLSQWMFPACGGSAEALQGRICSPLYVCELNPHFECKDLLMAWVETAPLGCELSSRVRGLDVFQRFEGRGITTTKREAPCSTWWGFNASFSSFVALLPSGYSRARPLAWLKLNLHCFSPTGRSDLGRELANPGCFMSLNFVNLKQIVCVQAMLRWGGGCAWDAFWDPRRWSKSYCRARLEPRRARPPLPLQDIKQSH